MIPTRRCILVLILGVFVSTLPIIWEPKSIGIWIGYLCGFFMVLIVSPLLVGKFKKTKVSLEPPRVLYLGSEDIITLKIESPVLFPVKARWRLEVSKEADVTLDSPEIQLSRNCEIRYRIRPTRRGFLNFQQLVVRIEDYLGIWQIEKSFPIKKRTKIVPDLRGVGAYALQFYKNPEARAGLKIDKYRGEGSEFESMREYVPGVDIRTIDWKASARRAKLVCREFRAEKNNDIILALDCGHLMAAEFNGLTKLDYAVNSILLLAYMAVKSGDQVGFFSFAEKPKSFLRPIRDESVVEQISEQCFGLTYDFQTTNFVIALEHLLAQQKRRSLIILFSDFVDSISAEIMKDYLFVASRRHLVLFVSVRDPFLDTFVEERPKNILDMHRQVACYDLRDERFLLFQELKHWGIHCLDLFPDNISAPVLNQYIEIRRKELI